MRYPLKKGKIYRNQEWSMIQKLLQARREGKFPALNKFNKRRRKHATAKSDN